MKKTILFCLMAAAMVCSCQKEEPGNETNKGNSGTSATIYIDGETVNPPVNVRSTDGTVYFEGGYATGAGIYDGKARPTVEAHPDKGYEVDFFYGGPESDPKKYDYITSGETTFNVALNGADHYFKCGFKEKKRTLTVNAASGGSATGSGTYKCDTPVQITATPQSGYTFAGWEVNEGDVQIENPTAANTTATLISLNSTITAKFSNPYNLWVNMDMEYFSSYYDLTRKQYFKGEYIEVPYCGIEQELSDKTGARLLYDLENYGYFNSRILVDDNLLKTIDIDWGYDIYITNMIETAKCTLTVHSETDDSKDYIIYYVTSSLPVANETDDIVWEDISVNINITDRTDTFTLTIPKGQNKSNELKLTKLVNNNITKAVCNKRLMYTTFKGEEIPASLNVVY